MRDLLSTGAGGRIYGPESQPVIRLAPMLDPRLQLLADRIRNLIEDSPYNATEVAAALDVDRSAVSRWMSGQRTPTVQNLIDLARLLEIDVRELWEGPEAVPATAEQRAMLDRMGRMTPEQQQAFLALAASMMGRAS